MATFGVNIEFIVEADSYESAESISKTIIDTVNHDRLVENASVQDIELLDDGESDGVDDFFDDEEF